MSLRLPSSPPPAARSTMSPPAASTPTPWLSQLDANSLSYASATAAVAQIAAAHSKGALDPFTAANHALKVAVAVDQSPVSASRDPQARYTFNSGLGQALDAMVTAAVADARNHPKELKALRKDLKSNYKENSAHLTRLVNSITLALKAV